MKEGNTCCGACVACSNIRSILPYYVVSYPFDGRVHQAWCLLIISFIRKCNNITNSQILDVNFFGGNGNCSTIWSTRRCQLFWEWIKSDGYLQFQTNTIRPDTHDNSLSISKFTLSWGISYRIQKWIRKRGHKNRKTMKEGKKDHQTLYFKSERDLPCSYREPIRRMMTPSPACSIIDWAILLMSVSWIHKNLIAIIYMYQSIRCNNKEGISIRQQTKEKEDKKDMVHGLFAGIASSRCSYRVSNGLWWTSRSGKSNAVILQEWGVNIQQR